MADYHSKEDNVEIAFKYLRQLQLFHSKVTLKDKSEDLMVKFDKSTEIYKKISRMWYRVQDKFDKEFYCHENSQKAENLLNQGHHSTDE